MEIVVESRKENKLLEREEINCLIKYDGSTPARKKIKEALKNHLGMSGYIVIHKVESFFGMKQAKVYAKIYPSEEVARRIEHQYILRRGEGKPQEGKQETKEEKKKEKEEEVKEEEKEEEKPEEKKEEKEGETNE